MKTLAVATALGTLLSVSALPGAPSYAAAETCRAQAATIVGTSGQALVGTEGPDVIVTAGALEVDSLGGDDLVCATGSTRFLDAGEGNDTVDTTPRSGKVVTILGDGDDVFTGGSGFDAVYAGPFDDMSGDGAEVDTGRDAIDTGNGGSKVRTGQHDTVNDDQIVTGDATGDENLVVYKGNQGTAGSLSFGDGPASLTVKETGLDLSELDVDNRRRKVTSDAGTVVTWTGDVSHFYLSPTNLTLMTVSFHGSAADETLDLNVSDAVVHADMGPGDDVVDVECSRFFRPGSRVMGGRGRDLARVTDLGPENGCRRLDVDLGALRLFRPVFAKGVEDLQVYGNDARVRGDDGPNTILVDGDAARIWGGGGRDRLIGGWGDDFLLGGGGQDVAKGRRGHDLCRAEVTSNCEQG